MSAPPNQVTIRPAQADDLARVAEIYNAGTLERVAIASSDRRVYQGGGEHAASVHPDARGRERLLGPAAD
jgi:hypothetical protein